VGRRPPQLVSLVTLCMPGMAIRNCFGTFTFLYQMRKLLFITVAYFSINTVAYAQYVYLKAEYGLGLGTAQYFGDLNQGQSFNYLRYSGTGFYKHNINPYISIKASATYALLGGADKLNSSFYEKKRNLSFESNVVEAAISGEFNFFNYSIGEPDHHFTPYINFGVGAMYYNPYTKLNSQKVYLRPLGTEGQLYDQYKDRRYSNVAMVVPVGMGIKYWVHAGLTFSFEVSNRFTTTDYLDDVSTTYVGSNMFPTNDPGSAYQDPATILQDRSSELGPSIGIAGRQRGISSTRDQYLFAQASLSFRIKQYVCPNQ
jgi:hypothetical protein